MIKIKQSFEIFHFSCNETILLMLRYTLHNTRALKDHKLIERLSLETSTVSSKKLTFSIEVNQSSIEKRVTLSSL